MPVTKKFDINKHLENLEEIDEQLLSFDPNYSKEEELFFEEKTTPTIPFWKKWRTILKSFLSKL